MLGSLPQFIVIKVLTEFTIGWIPPEPGRRGPVANIPIMVLQALNAVAEGGTPTLTPFEDQQAAVDARATGTQSGSPDSESGLSQESEGEKVSGWSSSPPRSPLRNNLPPDSSLDEPKPCARVLARNGATHPSTLDSSRGSRSSPGATQAHVKSGSCAPWNDDEAAFLESGDETQNATNPPRWRSEAPISPSAQLDTTPIAQLRKSPRGLEPPRSEATSLRQADSTAGPGTSDESQNGGLEPHYRLSQEHIQVHRSTQAAQNPADVAASQRQIIPMDLDSEDDTLESVLPQALPAGDVQLDEELLPDVISSPPPFSTAIQPAVPTVQVKRTPYVPGGVAKATVSQKASSGSHYSIRPQQSLDLTNTSHAAQADVFIPGTNYISSNPTVDTFSPATSGVDGPVHNLIRDGDKELVMNKKPRSQSGIQFEESTTMSPVKERVIPLGGTVVDENALLIPLHHNAKLHDSALLSKEKEGKHEKREASEQDSLSPFVTKRRKPFKPPAFHFSQDNRQTQDPISLGRKHRREFFASKKIQNMHGNDERTDGTVRDANSPHMGTENVTQSITEQPTESALMDVDQQPPEIDLDTGVAQSPVRATDSVLLKEQSPPRKEELTPERASVISSTLRKQSPHQADPAGVQRSPSSRASTSNATTSTHCPVYESFRSAYPNYSGELKHFLAMGRRIHTLIQADRMEHRSLWDDFVVRHKTDYPAYLLDCADRGDDPVPYEKFYRDQIDEPKHHKRILTPANLKDAITLIPPPEAAHRDTLNGSEQGYSNNTSVANPSPREPHGYTAGRHLVDLTIQDPPSGSISIAGNSARQRRSLPWSNLAKGRKTSSTSRLEYATPKSSLSGQRSTLTQTPSRHPTRPESRPQEQPLVPHGKDQNESHPACQTFQASNSPPDSRKSPTRPDTSESNRSTIVEWLESTSSETPSPPTSEPPKLDKKQKLDERERPDKKQKLDEKPKEEEQWWQDKNTPFKVFTRAYARLKSVEGRMGTIDEEGILRPPAKKLNVRGWSFD